MLLCFDIGNTNIKTALFDGSALVQEWRVSSDQNRTGDEYFTIIRTLIRDVHIELASIDTVVVSSVVPALIGPFVIVSQHLNGKKPFIIGPDMYNKLPVKVPESAVHEIGTDLLCDAVEAWCRYKRACIVADFGTALSFTAVDSKGNIAGIAIAPGIGTALKSLFTNTAQLPSVPLDVPPSSLGTNTIESIQSGILFGYKGLVEGMIKQMKGDLSQQTGVHPDDVKTIATGGLNSILQPVTDIFDDTDKELTLHGLKRVAELMK